MNLCLLGHKSLEPSYRLTSVSKNQMQAFFVQNRKTQFQIFKNSDPKNLEKLSFCLKTQFQTSQKLGFF